MANLDTVKTSCQQFNKLKFLFNAPYGYPTNNDNKVRTNRYKIIFGWNNNSNKFYIRNGRYLNHINVVYNGYNDYQFTHPLINSVNIEHGIAPGNLENAEETILESSDFYNIPDNIDFNIITYNGFYNDIFFSNEDIIDDISTDVDWNRPFLCDDTLSSIYYINIIQETDNITNDTSKFPQMYRAALC